MSNLADRSCTPCRDGAVALPQEQIDQLLKQLSNGWQIVDRYHLQKEYKFKDFREGLNFVNKVGDVADKEDHHPDVLLVWGKVTLTFWTHKVNGLTENDFILAAKADDLFS